MINVSSDINELVKHLRPCIDPKDSMHVISMKVVKARNEIYHKARNKHEFVFDDGFSIRINDKELKLVVMCLGCRD